MVIEADGSLGRVRPACRCPNPVFGPVAQGAGRPNPQDVSLPSADRANGHSYTTAGQMGIGAIAFNFEPVFSLKGRIEAY